MKYSKLTVRRILFSINSVHGKGTIVSVTWPLPYPYAGVLQRNSGVAVRQMQYGMDAVKFTVENGTVRFLRKTRKIGA